MWFWFTCHISRARALLEGGRQADDDEVRTCCRLAGFATILMDDPDERRRAAMLMEDWGFEWAG